MTSIVDILEDCHRPRRYFVVLGDEVDDPSRFKWFEDKDRAIELAKHIGEEGVTRVRVYDVDSGTFVFDTDDGW